MIDLDLFVKEFLALKANQEELTKRVEALEDEIADGYRQGGWGNGS